MKTNLVFGSRPLPLSLRTVVLLALVINCAGAAPDHDSHHSPEKRAASVSPIPPLPSGVTELKFGEFFVNPAEPPGLEGRRVRILGYMAHPDVQPPGAFLLTPFPVQLRASGIGLSGSIGAPGQHRRCPTAFCPGPQPECPC